MAPSSGRYSQSPALLLLAIDLACATTSLLAADAAAAVSQPRLLTRRVLGSLLLHPVAAAAAPPASQAPSRLYEAVAARRPSDWTAAERPAIDALVEEVAALRAPWRQSDLRGVWRLAYLLPGPDGAGVDRRVFGASSVTNVGELLGPSLADEAVTAAPKRFRADITRGSLCLGGDVDEGGVCAPLPIQGVGLFDGLYLDKRLRIGQNLNGGGARIVQVRVR
ncbi:hypothetical protein EMIHUDRAFT_115633 [Emiliania huxleyi CCMP1516]|uniref:Plastid lipid-associated protein/fibrillin conserved domain-containing protein n=2 Tax=Emiliania huxleyi TaxID=2903 RepID=A0A0D3JP61_EMIH1|nr:hypothetical protein EMIHUDRAFT_115633 [Emiliania huxleyi CCMP1516]EOD25296.1 hypothetical protein EMIHUDRAFT_115633 [Emiliania huxleyi CCMP1516]|eukprot:XP_005777725.1 hypothetical protein EMIHUDRAFT_115633 [Emiliania huxleyi CCMP1516]